MVYARADLQDPARFVGAVAEVAPVVHAAPQIARGDAEFSGDIIDAVFAQRAVVAAAVERPVEVTLEVSAPVVEPARHVAKHAAVVTPVAPVVVVAAVTTPSTTLRRRDQGQEESHQSGGGDGHQKLTSAVCHCLISSQDFLI